MISVFGILVSTAAMVIVLSAFNGFEGIVEGLYSSFDSDLQIELKEGKTFELDSAKRQELLDIPGVSNLSEVIEEVVLVKHNNRWMTPIMKGVDNSFLEMSDLGHLLVDGELLLDDNGMYYALLGYGIQARLGVVADPRYIDQISIHGLVRTKKIKRNSTPFNQSSIAVGGVFAINQDFDEKYLLVPRNFAAELLEYNNEINAIEMSIDSLFDPIDIKRQVQATLGEQFLVKTYFEQNALLYQTHQSEKWITFLILAFILVLSSFTLIASLTMLVIDKKRDIQTLFSMGATTTDIRRVFFLEGMLISVLGALGGLAIGYLVCWIQLKYHLVKLSGTIVPYYPIELQWGDFILILATLLLIGTVATYFPVRYLVQKHFGQVN